MVVVNQAGSAVPIGLDPRANCSCSELFASNLEELVYSPITWTNRYTDLQNEARRQGCGYSRSKLVSMRLPLMSGPLQDVRPSNLAQSSFTSSSEILAKHLT